jgi:hypothetical protein
MGDRSRRTSCLREGSDIRSIREFTFHRVGSCGIADSVPSIIAASVTVTKMSRRLKRQRGLDLNASAHAPVTTMGNQCGNDARPYRGVLLLLNPKKVASGGLIKPFKSWRTCRQSSAAIVCMLHSTLSASDELLNHSVDKLPCQDITTNPLTPPSDPASCAQAK